MIFVIRKRVKNMDKENCNAAFSGGNLFCPLLGAAQTYRKAKKGRSDLD